MTRCGAAIAWRLNSDDYDAEYFTEVRPNLRKLGDFDFARYGLGDDQVAGLRRVCEDRWPARDE